ncbi:MAG: MFS transporter [Candidatus Hodarchaeales archaeon]|jgi:DHA3 family macrolide efflux protein-like MFS transporter
MEPETSMNSTFDNQDQSNDTTNLPGYILIWAGQIISILGSGIVQFAIIWWLTEESGSTFVLALATFVGLVPMVIIGPFSGVLADRWNRKKILLSTDFLQALATIGLIVLFWIDLVEIWHVLLLIAIRGAFQAFQMPASISIVPQMVPKNQISRINGLGQIFNNFIFILSPVLGAIILEASSISIILWIDVITFLIAVFTLILVTIPPVIRRSVDSVETKNPSFKSQFVETFDYLKTHGWLPLIIGFTIGNILINPLFSLLPLFIKEVHLGGALELAFVVGIFQVGSLIGAVLIAVSNLTPKVITIVGFVFIAFLGLLAISLAPVGEFEVMAVGGLVIGFSIAFIDVGVVTLLQIHIPQELHGRIFSVTFTLIKSVLPIALLFIGGIAEFIALEIIYIVCPLLGILLVGYLVFIGNISSLDKKLGESTTTPSV